MHLEGIYWALNGMSISDVLSKKSEKARVHSSNVSKVSFGNFIFSKDSFSNCRLLEKIFLKFCLRPRNRATRASCCIMYNILWSTYIYPYIYAYTDICICIYMFIYNICIHTYIYICVIYKGQPGPGALWGNPSIFFVAMLRVFSNFKLYRGPN